MVKTWIVEKIVEKIANRDYIFSEFESAEQIATVYFGIGIALAILAALGFLMQRD